MIALIVSRCLQAIPTLLIVAIGSFMLLSLAPGDAADAYGTSLGSGTPEGLRAAWQLDRPPLERLLAGILALLQLDLGWSIAFSSPVAPLVVERAFVTLLLMGAAQCLALSAGLLLGVLAGMRPDSPCDRAIMALVMVLYATPSFWIALIFILIMTIKLGWLPGGGLTTIGKDLTGIEYLFDILWHLILPALTLSLVHIAHTARILRTSMASIWAAEFVRTAQAKGIHRRRILWRHVVRNALVPVVTVAGSQLGAMLGGSVVVESIFAIPGLGRLAFEAVTQRDAPLLMGIVLISTSLVLITNLVVDLICYHLDPRLRGSTR